MPLPPPPGRQLERLLDRLAASLSATPEVILNNPQFRMIDDVPPLARLSASDQLVRPWLALVARCMRSPEMAADLEDGKRFADLDKVYSVVVEEEVYIG